MYEPTNALYCPKCGKEVYPASEPCGFCGYSGEEMKLDAAAKFHEGYKKAKTWKDADELIRTALTHDDRVKLFEALTVISDFMGLDMRQEFYRTILRHSNV